MKRQEIRGIVKTRGVDEHNDRKKQDIIRDIQASEECEPCYRTKDMCENGLHEQQMNLRNNYRINKLQGAYIKNRNHRRHIKYPSKRLKNIRAFEILKRATKTAILLVSPETGKLPEAMGNLARYISGKAGGLGEVVSALCEGLGARGIDCHLATLDLKKRFQRESNMDESAWREIRYKIDPDKVHLVSSSIFTDLSCAYSGNPLLNAAEFQKQVVNNIIKTVRAKSGGRLILHSHDWMAGGAVTAYAKSRDCPVLHTVHNIHTGHIPEEMLLGVDVDSLMWNIYFSKEHGRRCIDSQATAIKSATLINFVGEKFLKEIIDDYFLDRSFIPSSVRQEVKAKYYHGAAISIMNAMSPKLYPETCEHLARRYDHDNDVMAAKRDNLVEFQKRTGLIVNPRSILLFWPSRLDPSQKGVELLEDIALKFVIEHEDVQIAVVGNGLEGDRTHEEILGRIACASGGKITYQRFNEAISMLGYAAASDVFGASLYEPCGQIDQIGNLFGATATNRDTGGYHDKIRELRLKVDGAPLDEGNGFLFKNYDSCGLWYGLSRSVEFHRRSLAIREKQTKRIMREARKKYDLDTMVDAYLKLYEILNGGPLS
jgi:glycogen synthase